MVKKEINLSKEFKIQTTRAIIALFIFFIAYLTIVSVASLITILCIWLGVYCILHIHNLFFIVFGIGISSFGLIILIFLFKFLFKTSKSDRSLWLEVTQKNEPALFKLISEIVNQVGTEFPKKVYLSSDVNASVFYDSNILSIFFPVGKNLQIGMGLVNSVSESELKAILSHEFGHFAQGTMRLGSFVYGVNKMIFDMIYENESFDKIIQEWADLSWIFSIVVQGANKVILGIQWLSRKLYEIVNLNYLGLSREMEFHADEIAAHVAGSEPLKNSLLRLNLADHAYQSVLNFYDSRIKENTRTENIFSDMEFVLKHISAENRIPVINNLPQVSTEYLSKYNKSKLVIKDQWSSHPTLEERIQRLERLGIKSEPDSYKPANTLFSNHLEIQSKLTEKLFATIKFDGEVILTGADFFRTNFVDEFKKNQFEPVFNDYYDNWNPLNIDIRNKPSDLITPDPDHLFSPKKIELVYMAFALQNDISIINQLLTGTTGIKTFDYDGIRYKISDCKNLLDQLEKQSKELNLQLHENDTIIYWTFKQIENKLNLTPKIEDFYSDFYNFDQLYDQNFELFKQLNESLQFINITTPFETIRKNFKNILPLETNLKEKIKNLMSDELFQVEINQEIKQKLNTYLKEDLIYFRNESYLDSNLELLFYVMNIFQHLNSKGFFLHKKRVLSYQAELLDLNMRHPQPVSENQP